jgi:hypothetical protein
MWEGCERGHCGTPPQQPIFRTATEAAPHAQQSYLSIQRQSASGEGSRLAAGSRRRGGDIGEHHCGIRARGAIERGVDRCGG